MTHYKEWKDLKLEMDDKNPYSARFVYENGDCFYVEPVFYLQLEGFRQRYPEKMEDIIKEMERLVKKNHLIVFEGDEENEITHVENAIYLTIQDVCNPLQIFVEDKSRGSDYGD